MFKQSARRGPAEERKKSPINPTILILIWMVIGLALAGRGAWNVNQAAGNSGWSLTHGEILSSDVVEQPSHEVGVGSTYLAEVQYRYHVEDTGYLGDRVAIGYYSSGSYSEAWQLAERYRQGSRVDVWFDPDDPEQAVLQRGADSNSWLELSVGAGILLLGAVLLYFRLKGKE